MRPARWSLVVFVALAGCGGPFIRSQSPEPDVDMPRTKLVGDYAVPFGMHPVKVEAVGLVTGLPGTGSDPDPSPQRDELLAEMKAYGVDHPNKILASGTASLVLVRAYLRPGIQQGDHFDIEVRVPSRSATTSLRGGWLMETRLAEMAVVHGSVREGSLLAKGQGPVLVDPSADSKDDNHVSSGRGRVLGGGIAYKSRPLALVLKPDHRSVPISSQIGTAINHRFHTYTAGTKKGVANPKDDQHVELIVHPRYKDNVERYMQVVRSVALKESSSQQMARLVLLERQLLDPITAAAAALKLEAIGKDGIATLRKGLQSGDAEIRFYAAEALAYLDQKDAVEPLVEAAREVPAFRAYALTALSAMDEVAAYDGLRELLDMPSNETRYGAFRALWAMNAQDPLVRGQKLNDQFSYHVLDTMGPELVHVTRSYRPEIVVFGQDQKLTTPFVIEAGNQIMLTGKEDRVTISRFAPNEPDQKRVVSCGLDDCIRAMADLGANYPDIVQALQQAKSMGVLSGRLAIDAVPTGGRRYDRGAASSSTDAEERSGANPEQPDNGDSDANDGQEESTGVAVANPLPGLFDSGKSTFDRKAADRPSRSEPEPAEDNSAKKARSWGSWLGTME
ncbi:MAG TPA: flagellar basal body P-ring protein FlgI [Pirellulales bacterium]|nr:flagellar basal body P-ring protein FlgI [Pirellulales bacterium]